MGTVFVITVCTVAALTSHPTPQSPLLIYALPATCWVFQHISLHFSLHCFTPIREMTVAACNQKQLQTWSSTPRENCSLKLQLREMALTLACVPLKMCSHQIYWFTSDTSSKKKKRHSSRAMKHIYTETKQHIKPWNMWSSESLKDIWPAQKTFCHPNL